jgi:hypothetical protein
MLPYKALHFYDSMGMISLLIIFVLGGRVVGFIVAPAINFLREVLLAF